VALSKEALKNLFGAMQKLSLAVAALCVGLLSSVLLSHPSAEKDAEREFERLLLIRDRLGKTNVYDLLNSAQSSALEKTQLDQEEKKQIKGQVEINSNLSSPPLEATIPRICRDSVDSSLGQKTFENISTLDEMRDVWHAIGAIRFFELKPKADGFMLHVGPANGRTFVAVQWKPSDQRGLRLRRSEEPFSIDGSGQRVSIEYQFSTLLDNLDPNELLQAFALTPDQAVSLKSVTLIITLPATTTNFTATISIDPDLGKNVRFG
jgi:hypothetical protein